ncbi:MAG: hypothetical protein EDM05_046920 [Leptolyngbya sp. IPPAS B-1204]
MVQSDLLKLAQQGDPGAIARLLNRNLQPRGVTAKVLLRDECLKILLSSDRPLEQKAFSQFIQQSIDRLGTSNISLVKLYSQQTSEGVPAWAYEFVPASSKSQLIVANPAAKSTLAIVKLRTESQEFWSSLRTFQLDSIFPYRDVLSVDLYRSNTVRLLLFLGLFPLIINLIAEQASIEQMAWLIGIYYAAIWGVVLYNLIKPVQFSWGAH